MLVWKPLSTWSYFVANSWTEPGRCWVSARCRRTAAPAHEGAGAPRRPRRKPVRTRFREAVANTELQRFPYAFAQFEYLSAVVIQKLVTGTTSRTDCGTLDERIARGASFDFVDPGPAPLR